MPPIQFLIEKREAGQTIAAVLRQRFTLTWSQAQRLVERGHVRVAGQTTRAAEQRVKKGNRVWIAAGAVSLKSAAPSGARLASGPESRPAARQQPARHRQQPDRPVEKREPESRFPLEIVYSDDAIVVVNKPAGLTSSREREDTEDFAPRARKYLPKTLADLLPAALGAPTQRVYPVHRLDRETTGLLVFARSREAASHLTRQFRKHIVDRVYLALTRGRPGVARIESVLVRDRGDGRRGSSSPNPPDPEGLRAVTWVKVLEEFEAYSLVQCRLETGRTHQVRIHLGEVGSPLCGERVYDRPLHGAPRPDGSGAKRPLLHATRLGLQHPETEEFLTWEVDPPADFANLLAKLRTTCPPQEPVIPEKS